VVANRRTSSQPRTPSAAPSSVVAVAPATLATRPAVVQSCPLYQAASMPATKASPAPVVSTADASWRAMCSPEPPAGFR
jgi:hypothetical protein